ncbi:hypothetical protein KPATCC21470_8585 [Kitasatospora purpeofusca]
MSAVVAGTGTAGRAASASRRQLAVTVPSPPQAATRLAPPATARSAAARPESSADRAGAAEGGDRGQ